MICTRSIPPPVRTQAECSPGTSASYAALMKGSYQKCSPCFLTSLASAYVCASKVRFRMPGARANFSDENKGDRWLMALAHRSSELYIGALCRQAFHHRRNGQNRRLNISSIIVQRVILPHLHFGSICKVISLRCSGVCSVLSVACCIG